MAKRVGIYIRVLTDGQTIANQRRELEHVHRKRRLGNAAGKRRAKLGGCKGMCRNAR
jgi:DNA invertase Pin-like site-specific DNA recombinase